MTTQPSNCIALNALLNELTKRTGKTEDDVFVALSDLYIVPESAPSFLAFEPSGKLRPTDDEEHRWVLDAIADWMTEVKISSVYVVGDI